MINSRAARMAATIFFFLIILTFSVTAQTTYLQTSGTNKTYLTTPSQINNEDDSLTTRTHKMQSPIIADLNANGVNEIIFYDATTANPTEWTLYAYTQNTLTPLDSININASGGANPISNIVVTDLNDDGTKEILYYEWASDKIRGFTFNSSNQFEYFTLFNDTGTRGTANHIMLNCDDDKDVCFIGYYLASVGNDAYSIKPFNYTHVYDNSITLFTDAGTNNGKCVSNIKAMPVGDYNPNNGNRLETLISYIAVDGTAQTCFAIGSVNWLNMSDVTDDGEYCQNSGSIWTDSSVQCFVDDYSPYVSPPTLMDINGFPSDGHEVLIAAANTDPENFKIYTWKIDGSNPTRYPAGTNIGNGRYVSNVFQANVLGTNYKDFCAVGYNTDNGVNPELLCASEINTIPLWWIFTTNTAEYKYPLTTVNITPDLTTNTNTHHQPNLVFGIEHANGNDRTEVVGANGIFKLETTDDDLQNMYEMPFYNGWVVPVDAEKVGFEDLIVGTGTGNLIYYIDDGFTNSNCKDDGCIYEIYTNPCALNGDVLQNGTQLQIKVTAHDFDDDNVNFRVSVYDETPYEQNSTALNQTSGSSYSFLFTLYNTTNTGRLKIEVWDSENPSKIEEENYNFIVGDGGFEFGDVDCKQNLTPSEAISAPEISVSATENILDGSFSGLASESGLSKQALWYLALIGFLLTMTWGVIQTPSHALGVLTGGVLLSFSWVFLGVFVGIVPFAHLIIIILILFLGLGIYFSILLGMRRGG